MWASRRESARDGVNGEVRFRQRGREGAAERNLRTMRSVMKHHAVRALGVEFFGPERIEGPGPAESARSVPAGGTARASVERSIVCK